MHTGGSRSAGTPVRWSLDFVRDRAVNLRLAEAARGPTRRRYAVWSPPGSAALAHLLDIYARGGAPDQWYSPVDPASPEAACPVWLERPSSARGGAVLRPPAAEARPCPDARARSDRGLDWKRAGRGRGPVPPHASQRRPSDLRGRGQAGSVPRGHGGCRGGEPITAARVAAMRRAGLRVLPRYAAAEAGLIGDGCLAPEWLRRRSRPRRPDRGRPAHRGGRRPAAERVARVVLPTDGAADSPERVDGRRGHPRAGELRVSLAALGWTTRLRSVLSVEKLTAEG